MIATYWLPEFGAEDVLKVGINTGGDNNDDDKTEHP